MINSKVSWFFSAILMPMSLVLVGCVNTATNGPQFTISDRVYDNQTQVFIEHVGDGPFDSYLAMTVDYDVVRALFTQLEQQLKTQSKDAKLKHRGEAHITVVTPVEYYRVLKPFVSMDTIHALAKNIQQARFEIVCIGRFEKSLKGNMEQTYYVVVASDDLIDIRKNIAKAFIAAGGKADDFDAMTFFPHITLGFSLRDLHLSDGAYKDSRSCAFPLEVQ